MSKEKTDKIVKPEKSNKYDQPSVSFVYKEY